MSRYRFELATPEDDADLRHVLSSTPMPGRIAVAFHREPSFFAASVVDGRQRQVIACRDTETGRIVGFGCRSLRDVYINGHPTQVGYLSSLRLLPEHRNLGLVARGYAFLRKLHEEGNIRVYLTTIAEGNETALKVLTSGRAGLPAYHPAGTYHTVAIPLPRRRKEPPSLRGVNVRPARHEDLPALLSFLETVGPQRQFFPRLCQDDFLTPGGLLHGLSLEDLLLAERSGCLVGMLAGWDQHGFRQSVVHGYSGWLHYARLFYNAWARLRGLPGLPAPGEALRYLMGALPVVADGDAEVFRALLETLIARTSGGAWTYLLLGLHERDPLLSIAQHYQGACYRTRLFLVCWPDGEQIRKSIDDRAPYLEVGSL